MHGKVTLTEPHCVQYQSVKRSVNVSLPVDTYINLVKKTIDHNKTSTTDHHEEIGIVGERRAQANLPASTENGQSTLSNAKLTVKNKQVMNMRPSVNIAEHRPVAMGSNRRLFQYNEHW